MKLPKKYATLLHGCQNLAIALNDWVNSDKTNIVYVYVDDTPAERYDPGRSLLGESVAGLYLHGVELCCVKSPTDIPQAATRVICMRQQRNAKIDDVKCSFRKNVCTITWCTTSPAVTDEDYFARVRCLNSTLHKYTTSANGQPSIVTMLEIE